MSRVIDHLCKDYLRSKITYSELTGYFYVNRKKIGSKPTKNRGYVTIWIRLPNGKRHRFDAHRLAYLYVHGYVPFVIDHVDGNRSNNSIENLRDCTPIENSRNTGMRRNNTSGFKGVSFFKSRNKWNARISIRTPEYKIIYKNLGYFGTKEEAYAAYCVASKIYHKEFRRVG